MKQRIIDIFAQIIAYTVTILLIPYLMFVGVWLAIEEWKSARPKF